jgi:hypothetical protein
VGGTGEANPLANPMRGEGAQRENEVQRPSDRRKGGEGRYLAKGPTEGSPQVRMPDRER